MWSPHGAGRAHRDVEQRRHRQAADVHDEAPADAGVGHQQAADRRPTSTPTCMPRLVRLLAAVIWSCRTVRGISASREALQRRGRHQQPGDDEHHPHVGLVPERVQGQHRDERRLGDPTPDQQPAAVDVVGQRPAVQAEDDQRHQLHEADRADGEVGAGQCGRPGTGSRRRTPCRRGRTRCPRGRAAGSRGTPAGASRPSGPRTVALASSRRAIVAPAGLAAHPVYRPLEPHSPAETRTCQPVHWPAGPGRPTGETRRPPPPPTTPGSAVAPGNAGDVRAGGGRRRGR